MTRVAIHKSVNTIQDTVCNDRMAKWPALRWGVHSMWMHMGRRESVAAAINSSDQTRAMDDGWMDGVIVPKEKHADNVLWGESQTSWLQKTGQMG